MSANQGSHQHQHQQQQQQQPQPSTSSSSPQTSGALIDEDDQEEEEEEELYRSRRLNLDPYNKPEAQMHHHRSLYLQKPTRDQEELENEDDDDDDDDDFDELEQQQQQYAYDSMSTILEVDSEYSDGSGDLQQLQAAGSGGAKSLLEVESPLMIRTQPTPDPQEGRVSPVGPDKFSGALSALAQQVERLRRSAIPSGRWGEPVDHRVADGQGGGPTTTTSGQSSEWSHQQHQQQPHKLGTNRPETPSSLRDNVVNDSSSLGSGSEEESSSAGKPVGRQPSTSPLANQRHASSSVVRLDTPSDQKSYQQSADRRPSSRTASTESLMMITVSPMASPRIKFPILRTRKNLDYHNNDDDDNDDQRRLVEVSNKSTITAIDLTLMDRMVQKYFVDTSEKATQSIEFDCQEHEMDAKGRPIRGGGGGQVNRPRPTCKSVAVGTEKFSRERFSLLPPTTTRSTQTKPNMDNDLGTSETRRYKLSHQLFGPVIRRQQPPAMEAESLTGSELTNRASSGTAPSDSMATEDTLEGGSCDDGKPVSPGASSRVSPADHNKPRKPLQREQHQQTSPEPPKIQTSQRAKQQQQQQHDKQVTTREAGTSMLSPSGASPISRQSPINGQTILESPRTQLKRLRTPTKQVQSATPERDSLVGSPELFDKSSGVMMQQSAHKTPQATISGKDVRQPESSDSLASSQEQVAAIAQQAPSGTIKVAGGDDQSDVDSTRQADSSQASSSEASAGSQSDSLLQEAIETEPLKTISNEKTAPSSHETKKLSRISPATSGNSPAAPQSKMQQSPEAAPLPVVAAAPGVVVENRATIPSLKTELRVIIEFNGSRQRQRSEITSSSQFLDGKLSKTTEVSTSKQVAASPREVLTRLQSIGREHSLLYSQGSRASASTTPPAAVAAANQSTLRSLSMSSLPRGLREGPEDDYEPASGGIRRQQSHPPEVSWREVSRSSVRNEIETDTRSKSGGSRRRMRRQKATSRKSEGERPIDEEDLVMTSDATINHSANDKSAIELRSRAVRRRESLERDPRTGHLVRSGRFSEQTLVESEAGFDENEAERMQRQRDRKDQPEVAHQQQPGQGGQARGPDEGKPLPPVAETLRRQTVTSATSPATASLAKHYSPAADRLGEETAGGGGRVAPTRSPASHHRPQSVRIEIDEESEDRRQVTKNGQLIFDDRLRERKFESQRGGTGGSPVTEAQRQQQWAWQRPQPSSPQSLSATSPQQLLLSPTMLQFSNRKSAGTTGAAASPVVGRSASVSPRSPLLLSPTTGGGILRAGSRTGVNAGQQRQLLKPISLRATPTTEQPILYADQTSNLSSDPETMDSGFAQSGVGGGSGSALNQAHRQPLPQPTSGGRSPTPVGSNNNYNQRTQRTHRTAPEFQHHQHGSQRSPKMERRPSSSAELEQPESLNFVDDDVDELIDQLDGSPRVQPPTSPIVIAAAAAAASNRQASNSLARAEREEATKTRRQGESSRTSQAPGIDPARYLIEPPAAFCTSASEPALNKLTGDSGSWRSERETRENLGGNRDTSLTTKLTRSKRRTASGMSDSQPEAANNFKVVHRDAAKKRTLTKLEQSLVAPEQLNFVLNTPHQSLAKSAGDGEPPPAPNNNNNRMCRFKAQVMFESDTDSMSTERHSVASSRSGHPKEIVSETKFSRGPADHKQQQVGGARDPSGASGGAQGPAKGGLGSNTTAGPKWDYSLRVNRMRGNRVDSKVNTYIKHSRQPLINSKAS